MGRTNPSPGRGVSLLGGGIREVMFGSLRALCQVAKLGREHTLKTKAGQRSEAHLRCGCTWAGASSDAKLGSLALSESSGQWFG